MFAVEFWNDKLCSLHSWGPKVFELWTMVNLISLVHVSLDEMQAPVMSSNQHPIVDIKLTEPLSTAPSGVIIQLIVTLSFPIAFKLLSAVQPMPHPCLGSTLIPPTNTVTGRL